MNALITPETVIDTLIFGSMTAGMIALVIAGQIQEMRFKRLNKASIAEVNRTASNYARVRVQMALTSEVIRKGHE